MIWITSAGSPNRHVAVRVRPPHRKRIVENASTMLRIWFAPMTMRSVNPDAVRIVSLDRSSLVNILLELRARPRPANSGPDRDPPVLLQRRLPSGYVLCAVFHRLPL